MDKDKDSVIKLAKLVDGVSQSLNADVVLYHGAIDRGCDRRLKQKLSEHRKRPNIALFLTTGGGSPDVAYRIARHIQNLYDQFFVFVGSYCKSAGTLLSIGANQIILSDMAELGPLDIQIAKPDDLVEYDSGLTPVQALTTLRSETFKCFEEFFIDIINKSQGQISTMSAARLALRLTTGCFSRVYKQISPMKLGEYERAINITYQYGERLDKGNLKSDALIRLITDYPSHGFVIDRTEAMSLFNDVRTPSQLEQDLSDMLRKLGMVISEREEKAAVEFLRESPKIPTKKTTRGSSHARRSRASKPRAARKVSAESPDIENSAGPRGEELNAQRAKASRIRGSDSGAAKTRDRNGKKG